MISILGVVVSRRSRKLAACLRSCSRRWICMTHALEVVRLPGEDPYAELSAEFEYTKTSFAIFGMAPGGGFGAGSLRRECVCVCSLQRARYDIEPASSSCSLCCLARLACSGLFCLPVCICRHISGILYCPWAYTRFRSLVQQTPCVFSLPLMRSS